MERAIRSITITPLAIVDAGQRARVPEILGAARYDGATVFFHDDSTSPEPTGFWVIGQRARRVTIAAPPGTAAIALRLRTAVLNQVRLESRGWAQTVELTPEETQEVMVTAPATGVVTLTIETTDGFVPAERDPSLTDGRFLGAWVEVGGAR